MTRTSIVNNMTTFFGKGYTPKVNNFVTENYLLSKPYDGL